MSRTIKSGSTDADMIHVADDFGTRALARRPLQRLRSRLRAASGTDDGFTLMETIMALMVIGTVLLMLVYGQILALRTTNVTKQREQLTSLANRYVEQMRAMPYAALKAGMNSADLAGDPNIVVGTVNKFRPAYDSSIDEEILASAGQTEAPLSPHVHLETYGPASYSVRLYVTKTPTYTASIPTLWVTAVAARVSGPGAAPKPVAVRTQVFSPSGCMSTSTRPYSGPCQAFFYGNSGTTQGTITLAGVGGASLLTQFGAVAPQLVLPGLTASTATEQTTTIESSAATSGVEAQTATGNVATGEAAASAFADDDPSTGVLPNPPAASAAQAAGATKTLSGTFGSVTMTPSSATVDAVGAAAASATVPCKDVNDATSTTSMPCAASKLSALAESVSVAPATPGLNTFVPATIGSSSTPGRAWAGRLALTQNSHCTGLTSTGSVGCVASEVKRATGAVTVGAVPTGGTKPAAWSSSLVSVTGYNTTAYSEQGLGVATSPSKASTSSRAGTVSYWNGTGYSSLTLGNASVSQALGSATFTYGGGATTLVVTGSINAGPVTAATTGPALCQTAACTTKTEVPALQTTATYTFTGAVTASFTVTVDLGSAIASTTYKAAPTP